MHVQAGINPPRFIKNIFTGIFIITMPLSTALLVIFSLYSAIGFNEEIKQVYMIASPLYLISIMIFIIQGEGLRSGRQRFYPEPSIRMKKILTRFIIPGLAIAAGASLSIVSSFYGQMKSFDFLKDHSFDWSSLPFIYLALFTFISFRYLIMRTAGVSIISLVSFMLSIALICIGYLTDVFLPY